MTLRPPHRPAPPPISVETLGSSPDDLSIGAEEDELLHIRERRPIVGGGSTARQRFDVVVVGGGPAGLSCSYELAKKGFRVVVLERGRTPGAKSLFGGRVYASPLERTYRNLRKAAPIERWVRQERMSMVSDGGSVSVSYGSAKSTSFTAHLPKLVSWMAMEAESEGALVVTDVRVDRVVMEDRRAVGVEAGGDRVDANVVVVAEGANRLLCEGMKIVPALSPGQVALGVREVVRLGSEKINERFGLERDEGLAWLFIGRPSGYRPGGAFLYTNSSTVSLGVVLSLGDPWPRRDRQVYQALEELRGSPPLKQLLAGGSVVEYGSHLIPEAGLKMSPRRLHGDGYVVTGDAAGLVLNLGYTVRGVDFAVHSGRLAAEAVEGAHSAGDFSSAGLAGYDEEMKRSFIFREMRRHSAVQRLMSRGRVFDAYPRIVVDAARRLYEFQDSSPKLLEAGRLSAEGARSPMGLLSDLLSLARGP